MRVYDSAVAYAQRKWERSSSNWNGFAQSSAGTSTNGGELLARHVLRLPQHRPQRLLELGGIVVPGASVCLRPSSSRKW